MDFWDSQDQSSLLKFSLYSFLHLFQVPPGFLRQKLDSLSNIYPGGISGSDL